MGLQPQSAAASGTPEVRTKLDAQFGRHAPYVRSYLVREGRLYLNLMADGGTYVWEAR